MNDLTSGTSLKQCSRKEHCINPLGSLLPATNEYFSIDKSRADGFKICCKICAAKQSKLYREKHPETAQAYLIRNADRIRKARSEYKKAHREQCNIYNRRYRAKHRIRINIARSERNANDPTRFERSRAYARKYRQLYPHKVQVQSEARRARKRALPDTLTRKEWERALDYFGGCCAACRWPVKSPYNAAADHWIPLSSPLCPGTIATNIVPLCHVANGCNSNKSNKPPLDWLRQRFGDKADEINERIETYFEWVRQQE